MSTASRFAVRVTDDRESFAELWGPFRSVQAATEFAARIDLVYYGDMEHCHSRLLTSIEPLARPRRLTRRGERVVLSLAIALGLGAGLTAQVWDPWTRALDTAAQK